MNTLIIYIVASIISLGVFYTAFIVFLRKEPLFRFNRIYLLSGLVLSYLVPLITLFPDVFSLLTLKTTSDGILRSITLSPVEISATAGNYPSLVSLLGYVYFSGLVFFALRFVSRVRSIYKLHRNSEKTQENETTIFWSSNEIPPFSFLHAMYLPLNMKNTLHVNDIIRHEEIHINSLHSFDILLTQLMQTLFWFNPFIPLVENALREIHEFEADKAVIHSGTDPVAYTRILFGQNKAAQAVILGNNFNYSLIKRRLTMFYKQNTRFARLKAAVVLPLAICAVMFYTLSCNQPANNSEAENSDSLAEATQKVTMIKDSAGNEIGTATAIGDAGTPPPPPPPPPPPADQKIFFVDVIYKDVETMPQFSGGEDARINYMMKNIKYPTAAKEKGVQGTVYVSFVIEKDGRITNTKVIRRILNTKELGAVENILDTEAIRVVSAMPKWTPGTDKGKPVRVQLTMPISFKLN